MEPHVTMTCGVADLNAFTCRKILVEALSVLKGRERRIFKARRLVKNRVVVDRFTPFYALRGVEFS